MICNKCGCDKKKSQFGINKANKSGRNSICKECRNKKRRESWHADPNHHRETHNKSRKKAKIFIRIKIFEYLKKHPCVDCGEADPIVLEFDHISSKQKTMGIATMTNRTMSWRRIKKEISKCRVLCSNCHKRRTAKQQSWYKDIISC